MRAEKLLVAEGCSVKLIPVPRHLSSDCGVALRFDWQQQQKVKSVLDNAQLELEAIHPL